jgi:hypothetical protein
MNSIQEHDDPSTSMADSGDHGFHALASAAEQAVQYYSTPPDVMPPSASAAAAAVAAQMAAQQFMVASEDVMRGHDNQQQMPMAIDGEADEALHLHMLQEQHLQHSQIGTTANSAGGIYVSSTGVDMPSIQSQHMGFVIQDDPGTPVLFGADLNLTPGQKARSKVSRACDECRRKKVIPRL